MTFQIYMYKNYVKDSLQIMNGVNYIIKSTRTILDVLNIEYTEENTLEDYNEQIIADFEYLT